MKAKTCIISTGASTSGEYSKSDSSIPDALHSNRKSADNGPENKKQTEVVPNEDSNGTDLHDNHSQMEEDHSPSVSSAGMCTPIYMMMMASTMLFVDFIFQVHVF